MYEGYKRCWKEEVRNRHHIQGIKESAHMYDTLSVSQPILDISPIWIPIIAAEVEKKNLNFVQCSLTN
jgi:hypothetical protein